MQAGGASLEWVIDVARPRSGRPVQPAAGRGRGRTGSEDGLYFLPHLLGERSPYWNPAARAVFAGLGRHHGPAHLTRAVLEGVAFNLLHRAAGLRENGTPIDAVDAIGGAANSRLLLQIFADVWGVPVTRRNLVDEATAVGAAIVGGVGVGIFDDFAVAGRFSKRLLSQLPVTERHERYLREYALFVEAYQRLETWFDKL